MLLSISSSFSFTPLFPKLISGGADKLQGVGKFQILINFPHRLETREYVFLYHSPEMQRNWQLYGCKGLTNHIANVCIRAGAEVFNTSSLRSCPSDAFLRSVVESWETQLFFVYF